ncbi:MAG: D-2-hydroxyacid dehydrogenase [Clostridia bacterium]|nr:D-2-hydroxyacid dehydrogenase [Clostridia bacterium]
MNQILVCLSALHPIHQTEIAQAASALGYSVCFCNEAQALAVAPQAQILLTASLPVIRAASHAQWVCVPSAGVEAYCASELYASPDTLLTSSSGAYGVTIAEHIIMVTLEMMRRRTEYLALVNQRKWQRDLPIRSLHGSRITLVGTGNIGQETARRLRAFSPACICGINRSGRNPEHLMDRVLTLASPDLRSCLAETDLLILSLPATTETENWLNAERLQWLPSDAYLVNVGRGSTIDQETLIRLMKEGHLAGAALDVFATEPLPPDDPIWETPRVLVTPHCSGNMTLPYTVDTIVRQFLENLERFSQGLPLRHLVSRSLGY